jgi:hypothetical protein
MTMWVAVLPPSFWDRLQARWGKPGQEMPLLRWLGEAAARLARSLPGLRRPHTPPAWTPPGGWVVSAVVLFLITYLVLFNTRNFLDARGAAFADPNRPSADNQAVLPNVCFPFAMALGIDQGWGLFAPRPGRTVGWILVVGLQDDGTHIDLLGGGRPIDDESPLTRPPFQAATFYNGRWRKLLMNLELVNLKSGARLYPYLERGVARYYYRDWNARHEGGERLRAVEVIYWKEESALPGEAAPPPERIPLLRYQPGAPREWVSWKPTFHDPSREPQQIVP